MAELTLEHLCALVRDVLQEASPTNSLSSEIGPDSAMGDPKEWDSLAFVNVFMAIGEAFGIELDEDDAIHFRSIADIYAFLQENL